MAVRKLPLDVQKVSVNLIKGDYHALRLAYPSTPPGAVIRKLVHDHVRKLKERENQ